MSGTFNYFTSATSVFYPIKISVALASDAQLHLAHIFSEAVLRASCERIGSTHLIRV